MYFMYYLASFLTHNPLSFGRSPPTPFLLISELHGRWSLKATIRYHMQHTSKAPTPFLSYCFLSVISLIGPIFVTLWGALKDKGLESLTITHLQAEVKIPSHSKNWTCFIPYTYFMEHLLWILKHRGAIYKLSLDYHDFLYTSSFTFDTVPAKRPTTSLLLLLPTGF